jgi:hypothetical protein
MIPFKILHGFEIIGQSKAETAPLIGDVILFGKNVFRVKQRAFEIREAEGALLCVEVVPLDESN